MKKLFKFSMMAFALTFTAILFSIKAYADLSEGTITLDLYPQAGDQIYAVGYTDGGVHYWYEIGQPQENDQALIRRLDLVYYDTVSKNFFVMQKAGVLTIVPINRPFELKFHDRTDSLPQKIYNEQEGHKITNG